MNKELKAFRSAALATIVFLFVGCSGDGSGVPTESSSLRAPSAEPSHSAEQNNLLATIRAGTAQYHDVAAALADGYVLASPCEGTVGGGIGVHYRKSSLFDTAVDPAHPELLVYEPQKNGQQRLVAVAFVVPAAAWDPTHASAPLLGEESFEDKRVPDWSSPPFPTWELHVWVWKHNPNGMYATTNPTVSCDEG